MLPNIMSQTSGLAHEPLHADVARSVRSRTETTLKQPSESSPFEPVQTDARLSSVWVLLKSRRMHTIILPFSGISVSSVPMLNELMPWRVLLSISFTPPPHR